MSLDQRETKEGTMRCFVVMGFGKKTDFATGRTLDLDKSYRLLIKPVVEQRGLICVRADEIRHSGVIDVPMYRELLTADVVIADLSTANPNAFYELGVRHALRPRTTIVISENKLSYPFDVNHITINSYTHLGEAIDYDEVLRFQQALGQQLDAVLKDRAPDSPIYTFLQQLTPPSLGDQAALKAARAAQVQEQTVPIMAEAATQSAAPGPGPQDKTLAMLIEEGEEAIQAEDFPKAKAMFAVALQLGTTQAPGDANAGDAISHDSYLIQRLVLATYKAKQPDEVSALHEALRILDRLSPEEANDPETVGLAGAIEKRLFGNDQGEEHLGRAIRHYERGYLLRNDWYNGINLAYLLNRRTDTALDATDQDRIADLVWANRIRREVLVLCERDLQKIRERQAAMQAHPTGAEQIKAEQRARDREQEFWCLVTQAEAHFALGEMAACEAKRSEAKSVAHYGWMMATFKAQIESLRGLLERHGHLLNPPWAGAETGGTQTP